MKEEHMAAKTAAIDTPLAATETSRIVATRRRTDQPKAKLRAAKLPRTIQSAQPKSEFICSTPFPRSQSSVEYPYSQRPSSLTGWNVQRPQLAETDTA